MQLFCLPYAGGTATSFGYWKDFLHKDIKLVPVELSGRGSRFNEPLYGSFMEMVEDVYQRIKANLDREAYAFFGHSMGALLVYEVYRKIRRQGHHGPFHLFLSGHEPPHRLKNERLHLLRDREFTDEILKLGGTPKEIGSDRELMKVFLPILRADYRILETYTHQGEFAKFDCALSILNGKDDVTLTGNESEWHDYTHRVCQSYNFNGGHFFLFDKENRGYITALLNTILQQKLMG